MQSVVEGDVEAVASTSEYERVIAACHRALKRLLVLRLFLAYGYTSNRALSSNDAYEEAVGARKKFGGRGALTNEKVNEQCLGIAASYP